jgi:hypothetical protein
MGTGIYVIQGDDQLIEMSEQAYDSEDLLQSLLAKYPNLLAGEQMNGAAPRRWLLVSREASVPSEEGGPARWSVDHLFLDQDGIPTLVEVKRSSDTRIRREVVGQMLDYAANAVVYWPMEALRATFVAQCALRNVEESQVVADVLGLDDVDGFWQLVKTNLQAGKVRMVFVADAIPPELQRIVEFLNGQMNPAEVLAVEIKQYVGQNLRTLVPRVIGQTAAAQEAKGGGTAAAMRWTEETFFQNLQERRPPEEVAAARRIYEWAKANTDRCWWGRGKRDGSCYPMLDHDKASYWVVALWSSGHVEFPLQYMTRAAFADESKRLDVISRLNRIPGVSIPPHKASGSPFVPLVVFVEESASRQLLEILTWIVEETRATW